MHPGVGGKAEVYGYVACEVQPEPYRAGQGGGQSHPLAEILVGADEESALMVVDISGHQAGSGMEAHQEAVGAQGCQHVVVGVAGANPDVGGASCHHSVGVGDDGDYVQLPAAVRQLGPDSAADRRAGESGTPFPGFRNLGENGQREAQDE